MRRPSPALAIALLALFLALDGPAVAQKAAASISGSRLRDGTVTSDKIRNGTLSTRDLSSGARRALTTPRNRSVTPSKLAPNSVGSPAIVTGAVGSADLAKAAVERDKVAANAIDSSRVADGSLLVRDVATVSGQTTIDYPALIPGQCVPATVDLPGTPNVADDVAVVTPPSNWPDLITVTSKLGPGDGSITVVACNDTGAPADPGPVNFRFAVLNQ